MRPTRRVTVALVALSLVATACSGPGARADGSTRDALVEGLQESVDSGTPLSLGDIISGDWDRVLFVCPYEEKRVVEDRLGFAWRDFPGRDDSEGAATFAFASDEAVSTWATISRSLGDPCSGSKADETVPRDEAVFSVRRTGQTADGRPFYSLALRRG